MFSPVADTSMVHALVNLQGLFTSAEGPNRETTYGLVILGWGIVALLGLLYALSPRLRKMLPRYVWNHRFYQEAIRRGREVIPVETTVILLAVSAAAGLFTAVWLNQTYTSKAFAIAVQALPPGVDTAVTELAYRAWTAVVLAGAATGLSLILWAAWLVLIANRLGQPIRYEQAFMLSVWPHWVLLVPAALAWVTAGTAAIAARVLFAIWLIGALWAMVRVWIDCHVVTKVRFPYTVILALGSPLFILSGIALVLMAGESADLSSFWKLVIGS